MISRTLKFVLVLTFAVMASAQTRVGTWNIDLQQSNFGTDIKPKSFTMRITSDTPAVFAYHVKRVMDDGVFAYRWRGPRDGTMRQPTIEQGGAHPGAAEGFKEVKGDLISHGVEVDGSLANSRLVLSEGGKRLALQVTWIHYDGSEEKQEWVFHRADANP